MVEHYKYVVMSERAAWAYALREYRQLKKQGTNILPEGTTDKQILEYVNKHLYCVLGPIAHFVSPVLRELTPFFI